MSSSRELFALFSCHRIVVIHLFECLVMYWLCVYGYVFMLCHVYVYVYVYIMFMFMFMFMSYLWLCVYGYVFMCYVVLVMCLDMCLIM